VCSSDLRFLDENGNWQEQWPEEDTLAQMTPGTRPDIALPRGIEVTLEHERFGELIRTFSLPDFEPSQAQAVINQQQETQTESEEEAAEEGIGQVEGEVSGND